jgi:hypothetical protein
MLIYCELTNETLVLNRTKGINWMYRVGGKDQWLHITLILPHEMVG